jgi:hypothetical protein
MDDDALRRGQPTLHVAFDEATAILVGDGCRRAPSSSSPATRLSAEQRVAVIACLAKAAGFEGMVGGQSLDMQATDRPLDLEELKAMHALKTGALITAALEMGALVAGASAAQRDRLRSGRSASAWPSRSSTTSSTCAATARPWARPPARMRRRGSPPTLRCSDWKRRRPRRCAPRGGLALGCRLGRERR